MKTAIEDRPRRDSFELANGRTMRREVGLALFRVGKTLGGAEVIFGAPRDEPLLGAVTLEALGFELDPARRRLRCTRLLMAGFRSGARATRRGLVGARGGSVTAIQRFGGALNANVHFHALIFDGVYTRAAPTARPRFHRLPPPTDADIAALLARLLRRVRRLLTRRGRWPEDAAGSDPFAAQEPRFAQTVAASLQGRVARGPRAGQPVRRLRSAAAATATGPRCARLEGFSLHADVAVPARRRDRLEPLVRYLVRPPLALEHLTESSGGQLRYQFRRAWSDGSTALLPTPLPGRTTTRYSPGAGRRGEQG